MAILKQPTQTSSIFELPAELPPRGTFVGTCIDIKDVFGVERRKYESEEMEKVDLTAFLFGFRTKDGTPHRIATRAMRISGSEKSGLYLFLKSWLGQPPRYGWDYFEMKGKKALITVDHQPSRTKPGVLFAVIASISPLPDGFDAQPAQQLPLAPVAPPMAQPVPATTDDDVVPF